MTRTLARLVVAGLVLVAALPAAAAANDARPIAIVGEDTLTTTDVRIELGLMKQRRQDDGPTMRPEAAQVLRRLVQNRLVIQEGYRMGLQDEFVVANPVKEFVMTRAMAAYLDSVALSVPADQAHDYEVRRLAVADHMRDLYAMYHVQVDSSVLASLDYGRDDDAYQQQLREDPRVLAVVPKGTLTVAGFSRIMRFKEYHGLVGKPDAAERRDEVFRNWVAEATLAHHLQLQGTLERPPFTLMQERFERDLVLQEALRVLLEFDFAPSDDEVQAFYEENIAEYTPPAMVRMASLKVANAEQAERLREKVLGGTPIDWLRKNDDTVIDGPPPFPTDFYAPEKLNIAPENVEAGYVPNAYQVPSGWVVARVEEVQAPTPRPLASCRNEVLSHLKAARTRDLMITIIDRLEEATPVTVMPDAEASVAAVIEEFIADQRDDDSAPADGAPATATPASPGQEG
ncbi:peptidyl-prolyl cis-trans isomerase [bacterium]|nr:peptidyl-prolyl cis-trans isomerase [bacterium]